LTTTCAKKGKTALATLPFIRQWRFHARFRMVIERHVAWAKRSFGLEAARWSGLVAAYQHTALGYSRLHQGLMVYYFHTN
jgi:hypothetical protein